MLDRTNVLTRLINRLRFPGLGAGDGSYDVRGSFSYGTGCSIGTRAVVIVPEQARLCLGDGVYVGRHVELGAGNLIDIGDSTSIQDRCLLVGDVFVGRYCSFSLNVLMTSGAHYPYLKPEWNIKDQDEHVLKDPILSARHSKPIHIEDDCWIGTNSVILAGVTVGKGCVIGANSVVTGNLPPYTVAVGAPAQAIKARLHFLPPKTLDAFADGDLPYFYSGFGVSAAERAAGRPSGGLLAKTEFSVAAQTLNARRISITARFSETPCALKFGHQAIPLHPQFTDCTYSLEPDQPTPVSFSVVGANQAKWPVCISKISVE